MSGTPTTWMSSRNLDFGSGLVESYSRYPPGSIEATSLSQVCGFIATIRSTPPRAPRWPASVTRTSYQVGRPWMLEGKMLRGLTGTPMRRMARANSSLAEADPEPLTFANLTTKSLTAARACLVFMCSTRSFLPFADSAKGGARVAGGGVKLFSCADHDPSVGVRRRHLPQLRWGGSDY